MLMATDAGAQISRLLAKTYGSRLLTAGTQLSIFAHQPRESSCAVILGRYSFVDAAAVDGYDDVVLWWQMRQR